MQDLIIKDAKLKDITQIRSLLEQLGYFLKKEDLLNNLKIYIQDPLKTIFVAKKEKALLGFITIHLISFFHSKYMYSRVTALIVDEKHRNKKIGSMLLKKAETFSVDKNCAEIELTTGSFRKNAQFEFLKSQECSFW